MGTIAYYESALVGDTEVINTIMNKAQELMQTRVNATDVTTLLTELTGQKEFDTNLVFWDYMHREIDGLVILGTSRSYNPHLIWDKIANHFGLKHYFRTEYVDGEMEKRSDPQDNWYPQNWYLEGIAPGNKDFSEYYFTQEAALASLSRIAGKPITSEQDVEQLHSDWVEQDCLAYVKLVQIEPVDNREEKIRVFEINDFGITWKD